MNASNDSYNLLKERKMCWAKKIHHLGFRFVLTLMVMYGKVIIEVQIISTKVCDPTHVL
jgi:hypothetical protein